MAFDGNTIATAEAKSLTGSILNETFTISFSDVDMMSITLQAGHSYEIDVDSGDDSYLRIFDAFGTEVRADDDGFAAGEAAGVLPYTQFMPNSTGTYYIAFSPIA